MLGVLASIAYHVGEQILSRHKSNKKESFKKLLPFLLTFATMIRTSMSIGKMLLTPEDVACSVAENHVCARFRGMKASRLIYQAF
jgi:hypothetical protein